MTTNPNDPFQSKTFTRLMWWVVLGSLTLLTLALAGGYGIGLLLWPSFSSQV